mmetsp:Transcript_64895/g.169883  ORF Transcript_64895/g.169883 Transcript_64895/m.169883 type:complete len:306 (+) Transcript_64895:128-1045(+)
MSVQTSTASFRLRKRSMRFRRSFCRMRECRPSTSTMIGGGPCALPTPILTFESTLLAAGLSRSNARTDWRRSTEVIALTNRTTRPPVEPSAGFWASSTCTPGTPEAKGACSWPTFQRYRLRSHIASIASRSLSSLQQASCSTSLSGSRPFEAPRSCTIGGALSDLPPLGGFADGPMGRAASSRVRSTMCTARASRNLRRRMRAATLPPSSSPSLRLLWSLRGSSVSVAEKTKVWSCPGLSSELYTKSRMLSSSLKWPDSTKRSASSRTRCRRPEQLLRSQSQRSFSASLPRPRSAQVRPGVPTTT